MPSFSSSSVDILLIFSQLGIENHSKRRPIWDWNWFNKDVLLQRKNVAKETIFIKIITNKFGWINAYLTTRLILLNCFKRWNGPEFEILLRLTTVFLLYCQAVRSLKWTREAESEGGWSPAWLAGCGSTCRTSASLLELDLACSFGGVSECLQAWQWTVRNLTVQPNLKRRRSNTVRQVQLLSRNTDNLHRKLKCHLEIFYTAVLARWRCKMRWFSSLWLVNCKVQCITIKAILEVAFTSWNHRH